MRPLPQPSRSTKIFIGLAALYLALTFILPASHTTKAIYHLSTAQYYYLVFIVKVPIVAVWCVAFYSYRALHGYVERLHGSPEAHDFTTIRNGMYWIAWGLPIPAIASSLLNAIANVHGGFRMFALIIANYLYVVVSLFAFSYICGGSHRLALRSKVHLSTKHIRLLVLGLVTIGVLFCCLIDAKLHAPNTLSDSYNSYYLPNVLVWLTIVIPYLYAWFVGLFAALELMLVARHTKGIIYRQALQFLAVGLVTVIISGVMLQYFRSVIPRTGYLTIGGALLTTYGIYAINVAGSVLLAIGARRLTRIEDI